ncbi:hypothetical protein ACQKP3_11190 [Vibrio sp. DNB22_10_4]
MRLLQGTFILLVVLMTGCSERYFNGKGAETLIYPETHVYEFTVKSEIEAQEKLKEIFTTIDDIDSGPSYIIEYKNNTAKKIVSKSFESLPFVQYRADVFEWKRNSGLISDLRITVTFHNMANKQCKPVSIEQDLDSRDCFSENARNRQIAHKERLVEGI